MTHCNTDGMLFSSHGRRQLHADFNGGRLITDAGVLLLREADQRLKLSQGLAAAITDPRDPAKIEHDQQTLLAQRLFAIACGYEDLNDHHQLRTDPALQIATDQPPTNDQPLGSPPTLSRLENRISRQDCWRMHQVFVERFIASFKAPPEQLVLDFDATDDPLHGQQEGRFFHGYYDHYCYLPLYVFCGDELLAAYLRPSNIDPSKHTRAILKLLVKRLREVWPQVQVIVRADSGFCRWRGRAR